MNNTSRPQIITLVYFVECNSWRSFVTILLLRVPMLCLFLQNLERKANLFARRPVGVRKLLSSVITSQMRTVKTKMATVFDFDLKLEPGARREKVRLLSQSRVSPHRTPPPGRLPPTPRSMTNYVSGRRPPSCSSAMW